MPAVFCVISRSLNLENVFNVALSKALEVTATEAGTLCSFLMSKEKVVGALALGTKKKRIFTQDDLDLLFSVGNIVGIAAENSQLYKESKESLEKLQKAYEELQTLDKMKDEFISNGWKDLNKSMNCLRVFIRLMRLLQESMEAQVLGCT